MKKTRKRCLIWLTVILLAVTAGILFRTGFTYDNREPLTGTASVTVTEQKDLLFFDGPGTETALIFYPGALVQHTAYSDLMQRIAAGGVDCFLVRMPLRLAILNRDAADGIIAEHPYRRIYLGGHSLGGAVACMYAADHPGKITGLVLLAAYSSGDLSESGLRVLSLTGSLDGVIRREKQESGKKLLPGDTVYVEIEGGNHAGFGTYGAQRGDQEATISGEEQRRIAAEEILAFLAED